MGSAVGAGDGAGVGEAVGDGVGEAVGDSVGEAVGSGVCAAEGIVVGCELGWFEGRPAQISKFRDTLLLRRALKLRKEFPRCRPPLGRFDGSEDGLDDGWPEGRPARISKSRDTASSTRAETTKRISARPSTAGQVRRLRRGLEGRLARGPTCADIKISRHCFLDAR